MDYDILSKKPATLAEVKELFKGKKDLTYEQRMVYEHAKTFAKVKLEDVQKIFEDLKALGMRKLTDELIVTIINIMPETEDELRSVVAYHDSFKPAELKQILEVLKKYR